MQVVLVMFRSDGERRSFSVVRNMTIIGRREDCDLRIPVGDVSRKHCRLVLTDDGVRIEDLGSSNGTHVNNQRVQESDLQAGDVVGIGPVQFIVQIDGMPDEDEMVPPGTATASDDSSMMGHHPPTDELASDELLPEEDLSDAPSAAASHPAPNPHAANDEMTIDEDEMVIDGDADVEPLDELHLDEAPLEEIPLEELPAEEAALEEIPLEELPLEEPPAEESPVHEVDALVEAPQAELAEDPMELEEITDEAPAVAAIPAEEEMPLEELPPETLAENPAAAPAPIEGLGEDFDLDELGSEEFPIGDIGEIEEIDESSLEITPAESAPVEPPSAVAPPVLPVAPPPVVHDELNLDHHPDHHPDQHAEEHSGEPLNIQTSDTLDDDGTLDGLELLDELEPLEPAAIAETHHEKPAAHVLDPAALLPTGPVEEIEPVNLDDELTDEIEPHEHAATNKAASESAWDFVIEETDGERSHHDFKIDLDSPHQQPLQ